MRERVGKDTKVGGKEGSAHLGVTGEGRRLAGDEGLALSEPDDHGRAVARHHDLLGLVPAQAGPGMEVSGNQKGASCGGGHRSCVCQGNKVRPTVVAHRTGMLCGALPVQHAEAPGAVAAPQRVHDRVLRVHALVQVHPDQLRNHLQATGVRWDIGGSDGVSRRPQGRGLAKGSSEVTVLHGGGDKGWSK